MGPRERSETNANSKEFEDKSSKGGGVNHVKNTIRINIKY
jgi:hypothetical protein